MKSKRIYSKTETETSKAMKKVPLVLVLFCTFNLLSFNACSPGYGCSYAASETVSGQVENSTTNIAVGRADILSEEIKCLP